MFKATLYSSYYIIISFIFIDKAISIGQSKLKIKSIWFQENKLYKDLVIINHKYSKFGWRTTSSSKNKNINDVFIDI